MQHSRSTHRSTVAHGNLIRAALSHVRAANLYLRGLHLVHGFMPVLIRY